MEKFFILFTFEPHINKSQAFVGTVMNLVLVATQIGFFAYAIGLGLKLAGL